MSNFLIKQLMVCLAVMAFSALKAQSNIPTPQHDTIYFFSGDKIAATIYSDWANHDYIRYAITDLNGDILNTLDIDKSLVHYIYINGQYHLINQGPYKTDIERIQHNLSIYHKKSTPGWLAFGAGIGFIISGIIVNEEQMNRFENTGDPNVINNLPKHLNYTGYGLMFVGSIIHISSLKFLKQASIDITPIGVKVNL